MIYILLMLILAVLLFGSAPVIGFLGIILGFIVAAIALLWASIAFGFEPWMILMGIVGALIALIPIGKYCDSKLKEEQDALNNIQSRLTPEARKMIEESERRAREKISMKKLSH